MTVQVKSAFVQTFVIIRYFIYGSYFAVTLLKFSCHCIFRDVIREDGCGAYPPGSMHSGDPLSICVLLSLCDPGFKATQKHHLFFCSKTTFHGCKKNTCRAYFKIIYQELFRKCPQLPAMFYALGQYFEDTNTAWLPRSPCSVEKGPMLKLKRAPCSVEERPMFC